MRLGLRIKGTLGVLIAAKRNRLLSTIRTELEALRAQHVYISQVLIAATLKEAGE